MLDGSTLVLVEVRSRSTSAYGDAASTVGARKRLRFIRAARHLLLARPDYGDCRRGSTSWRSIRAAPRRPARS